MSFNPVRAKNFYKSHRKRHPVNPHSGTKHSDIVRKNGLGVTVPAENRRETIHGFASELFGNDNFVVRSELLRAGNSTGFGVHHKSDRLYVVTRGMLYVTIEGQPAKKGESAPRNILPIQQGGCFRAVKGLRYGVASSGTSDVEIMVIEDAGYTQGLEAIDAPESREYVEQPTIASPQPIPESRRRPTNQKAKQVQNATAGKRNRRRGRPVGKQQPGTTQTASGSVNAGRSKADNANSANVIGVNPRPMGPPRE